jgi:hypothetical protein
MDVGTIATRAIQGIYRHGEYVKDCDVATSQVAVSADQSTATFVAVTTSPNTDQEQYEVTIRKIR